MSSKIDAIVEANANLVNAGLPRYDDLVELLSASTRYGMVFQIDGTRQICAFTDYRIVNATVNVIDVKTNESVAILKQRGSDGPCTTVTPVFDSLAEEIVKLWN